MISSEKITIVITNFLTTMKKYFNYAFAGAIALLGAMGFTSCSSSEDAESANVNPTYDPAKNTVTTQFVLNVASKANSNTRSGATDVQESGNFRGIEKVKLFSKNTFRKVILF